MAAFRCFDSVQMQLPWRWGGAARNGAGCEGGDAASFCQLQGYPRRTQRGTKESGDGDPREMTANLDRALPPAWTGNRADRVLNPFAARHHWFNLQCLNPIWKRSWQHFGALTQFRCNCPGGGGVQPGMGAGCEGGRCGFLLPASRISTKDTKGHEGKRRRRSQGDDRKSGPRTAAGADCEQGRSSLQPVCCAPSLVQFTVSEPDLEEIMAALRCFDPVQMQLPWRWGGAARNGGGV